MERTSNHYEALGIKRDATLKEIKAAYHKTVLAYHPDKTRLLSPEERADSEYKTKLANLAWECLREPRARKLYDIKLAQAKNKSGGGIEDEAEDEFDDINVGGGETGGESGVYHYYTTKAWNHPEGPYWRYKARFEYQERQEEKREDRKIYYKHSYNRNRCKYEWDELGEKEAEDERKEKQAQQNADDEAYFSRFGDSTCWQQNNVESVKHNTPQSEEAKPQGKDQDDKQDKLHPEHPHGTRPKADKYEARQREHEQEKNVNNDKKRKRRNEDEESLPRKQHRSEADVAHIPEENDGTVGQPCGKKRKFMEAFVEEVFSPRKRSCVGSYAFVPTMKPKEPHIEATAIHKSESKTPNSEPAQTVNSAIGKAASPPRTEVQSSSPKYTQTCTLNMNGWGFLISISDRYRAIGEPQDVTPEGKHTSCITLRLQLARRSKSNQGAAGIFAAPNEGHIKLEVTQSPNERKVTKVDSFAKYKPRKNTSERMTLNITLTTVKGEVESEKMSKLTFAFDPETNHEPPARTLFTGTHLMFTLTEPPQSARNCDGLVLKDSSKRVSPSSPEAIFYRDSDLKGATFVDVGSCYCVKVKCGGDEWWRLVAVGNRKL